MKYPRLQIADLAAQLATHMRKARDCIRQFARRSGHVLLVAGLVMGMLALTGASPVGRRPIGVVRTPTLGNYPDTSIVSSGNITVTPDAAATNATSISVSISTSYKGKLEGYPATGVIRVTDAHPAGTYTVTVRAFDSSGASATRTFTLIVTTPVTCTPVNFAAATNLAGNVGSFSVVVGDFNGDSKQDLAVANYTAAGTVSILLGNGVGSFSSPTNFNVGNAPFSVAVGDFNGDGKQDLAVVNSGSNNVSILLGDGTGRFSALANLNAGSAPVSVAVGDFNGDGKQDLAVANTQANNVSIFLGDGTGHFSAATNFNAGSGPYSVAVGDFNTDGKQDLAVANPTFPGKASILLGDGTGSFSAPTSFTAGSASYSLAVGDFNGDGKQDLALTNYFSNNVSILLGDGTGNFSGPTDFAAGDTPWSVAVGDFNGDGKQDLAIANVNTNKVSILLGDGTGNFAAATNYGVGNFSHSVAVGDFNGDGKQDLAVANDSLNHLSILLRDCALTPINVVSRMTHGEAGMFDINLPITGAIGIECRRESATNDYSIVVTFDSPITVTGNPQGQVTLGTGAIGNGGVSNGGMVSINGNVVTVPLTNVANAQTINVTLFGVNSSGNVTLPMRLLIGDLNADGVVNGTDVVIAKLHVGQEVNATNFRADIDANGAINSSDVSLVKSKSGTGIP